MGNCLVTKLNATVDNDNLVSLGYEKYRVNITSVDFGAIIKLNQTGEVILLDGVWNSNNSRKEEAAANTVFYINSNVLTPDTPGQQYVSVLIPKYTCYYYQNLLAPVEGGIACLSGFEFGSADNVTDIAIATWGGVPMKGIEYAPLEKAKIFAFYGATPLISENPIDLTNLGRDGKLTTLCMAEMTNVIGSLDNLGKSNVTWNSSTYLPVSKEVSIDLVNFVNNRRTAGATTGTITFRFLGNLTVKANGVVLDVPVQSNNVLAWDASSITLDGTSIG